MFIISRSGPSATIDTWSNSLVEELIARDVQYHRDSRLQINEGLVVSTATSSRRGAEQKGVEAWRTRRSRESGRWRQIEKIVSREINYIQFKLFSAEPVILFYHVEIDIFIIDIQFSARWCPYGGTSFCKFQECKRQTF
ncbi:hypothetical protein PUN28_017695 [Cardiocondyla obscurior]|uniref:Uncharacterized protein n=1 Tax=Cardiocondyla obscurior TaxID=286306 RepID=A0AAW2EMX9_9HYME